MRKDLANYINELIKNNFSERIKIGEINLIYNKKDPFD